jgi:hypothetical protein
VAAAASMSSGVAPPMPSYSLPDAAAPSGLPSSYVSAAAAKVNYHKREVCVSAGGAGGRLAGSW